MRAREGCDRRDTIAEGRDRDEATIETSVRIR